jgi:hypothetical protein
MKHTSAWTRAPSSASLPTGCRRTTFSWPATPKDQRLTDFLAHAGYSGQEHFSVSRDDVVKARLNKQYIEAVVYSLGTTMQQVTDLRRTVLRQAWARNVDRPTAAASWHCLHAFAAGAGRQWRAHRGRGR